MASILYKHGVGRKKYNSFIIRDNYVILYTFKNEPFLVDIEDFGRIRNYCWRKSDNDYIVTTINRHTVFLHRMIMNAPDNLDVDHEHGSTTKFDNRKSNLRLATTSQNGWNKVLQTNNTSGVAGVSWNKRCAKWRVRVHLYGKEINIGYFTNIDDAIAARYAAEDKYYGEFGYRRSRNIR